MLRDKQGNQLYPWLRIRVFERENKKFHTTTHRIPGKCFTEQDIEKALTEYANKIEKIAPRDEYGIVQIAPNVFNFVWRAYKSSPEQSINA